MVFHLSNKIFKKLIGSSPAGSVFFDKPATKSGSDIEFMGFLG